MEEAHNWIDKPSEERNLTDRSRGAGKSSMHALKRTGREGKARGTSNEGNNSFYWVCRYCGMPRWIDLV